MRIISYGATVLIAAHDDARIAMMADVVCDKLQHVDLLRANVLLDDRVDVSLKTKLREAMLGGMPVFFCFFFLFLVFSFACHCR